jgi:LmbE family N-acetylglucosaminyl deacetylase
MPLTHFIQPHSILWIVAPHADDEALGCGGLIALARERGASVYVLYTTLSGYVPLNAGQPSSHEDRRREVQAAATLAGIHKFDVLFDNGNHHCMLDTVPLKEIIDWLESGSEISCQKIQPDILLIPSAHHSHQDHRRVNEAVHAVMRISPAFASRNRLILEYETPGAGLSGLGGFEPNLYFELSSSQLDAKCEMFACYRSQQAEPPHLRSAYALRALAASRGIEAGYHYAEAYRLLRGTLKVADDHA